MAYLLYSLIFLTLCSGTILYATRAHWLAQFEALVERLPESLPGRGHLYSRLPSSSPFAQDMEAGLSSSTFDLTGNVEGGDARAGLDSASKVAILAIMKKRRMKFDEARKVYMEQRFMVNGIGLDGRPQDPKFVSFS